PRAATTLAGNPVLAWGSITSADGKTRRGRPAAAPRWVSRVRPSSTAYGTATLAPSARSRKTTACPSAPVPPVTTATRPVIGAGTVGPALTEGGLRQARPGSARRYSARGVSQARLGVHGLAEPGFLASSLGRGGHDRGALDLVVADLADVELLEVVAELLEGLLERRQRLARARERGRAREEVVLDVGMVDPSLLDLRHR